MIARFAVLKAVAIALAAGIYFTIVVTNTTSPLPILIAGLWSAVTICRLFSIFGKEFVNGARNSVIKEDPLHPLASTFNLGDAGLGCGSNGTPVLSPGNIVRIKVNRIFVCPECEGQGAFVYQNAKRLGYSSPVKINCPGCRGQGKMQGHLDWQFIKGAGNE